MAHWNNYWPILLRQDHLLYWCLRLFLLLIVSPYVLLDYLLVVPVVSLANFAILLVFSLVLWLFALICIDFIWKFCFRIVRTLLISYIWTFQFILHTVHLEIVFFVIKRLFLCLSWITGKIRLLLENIIFLKIFLHFCQFRALVKLCYFWIYPCRLRKIRFEQIRFKQILIFKIFFLFWMNFVAEPIIFRLQSAQDLLFLLL